MLVCKIADGHFYIEQNNYFLNSLHNANLSNQLVFAEIVWSTFQINAQRKGEVINQSRIFFKPYTIQTFPSHWGNFL